MDGSGTVHAPGIVDVEAGEIVWVGPADAAPPVDGITTNEVSGALMPGMVNTHAHTPMLLLRGAGEALPVDRWLREVMWPLERKLVSDDVHAGMLLGASELLANGITTSVEMYFYGEAVAQAAVAPGLRVLAAPPIIEDPQMAVFGGWQARLDEIGELSERWASEPRVEIGIGPHAPYSTSAACLEGVASLAKARDLLVHMHVSEQRWEEAAVREQTGRSAMELLESTGILDGRFLAAHCVWLSEAEIETFAAHKVAVAHCPCSNCKHASGVAPVEAMREAGISVGIATDGPASHHRLDLFEEMRMAIRLARVHHADSERLPADAVLRMVTAEAADAIGRPDLGRLQAGARADMLAISMSEPALHPILPKDDVVARIVWSGSPRSIDRVWVEGTEVVSEGKVLTVDRESAIAEATARAAALAN